MGISSYWDHIIDGICRPPRDMYHPNELIGGVTGRFKIGQTQGHRRDVQILNKDNMTLQCSHFLPYTATAQGPPGPCVIYCHTNSGSRRDAEEAICVLLPQNISVFTLDFAGSGLSGGQWVTLGAHEVEDLEVAVAYLRGSGRVTTIAMWGRSMGAVTALMYSQRDPSVAGIVLDSPFSRLTDLMLEVAEEYRLRIPKSLTKVALAWVRRSVKKRAGFDIYTVSPIDVVGESYIPALFGHAEGDSFVRMHHSQALHDAYAGDKNLIAFGGDHNSARPQFFYDSVSIFLHTVMEPGRIAAVEASKHVTTKSGRQRGDFQFGAVGESGQAVVSSRGALHTPMLDLSEWAAERSAGGLVPQGDEQQDGDAEDDALLQMVIEMSLREAGSTEGSTPQRPTPARSPDRGSRAAPVDPSALLSAPAAPSPDDPLMYEMLVQRRREAKTSAFRYSPDGQLQSVDKENGKGLRPRRSGSSSPSPTRTTACPPTRGLPRRPASVGVIPDGEKARLPKRPATHVGCHVDLGSDPAGGHWRYQPAGAIDHAEQIPESSWEQAKESQAVAQPAPASDQNGNAGGTLPIKAPSPQHAAAASGRSVAESVDAVAAAKRQAAQATSAAGCLLIDTEDMLVRLPSGADDLDGLAAPEFDRGPESTPVSLRSDAGGTGDQRDGAGAADNNSSQAIPHISTPPKPPHPTLPRLNRRRAHSRSKSASRAPAPPQPSSRQARAAREMGNCATDGGSRHEQLSQGTSKSTGAIEVQQQMAELREITQQRRRGNRVARAGAKGVGRVSGSRCDMQTVAVKVRGPTRRVGPTWPRAAHEDWASIRPRSE